MQNQNWVWGATLNFGPRTPRKKVSVVCHKGLQWVWAYLAISGPAWLLMSVVSIYLNPFPNASPTPPCRLDLQLLGLGKESFAMAWGRWRKSKLSSETGWEPPDSGCHWRVHLYQNPQTLESDIVSLSQLLWELPLTTKEAKEGSGVDTRSQPPRSDWMSFKNSLGSQLKTPGGWIETFSSLVYSFQIYLLLIF